MKIEISGRRDRIHPDEEYFLEAAEQPGIQCPQLQRLFRDFYKDPKIFPNHAASMAAELNLIHRLAATSASGFEFPDGWKKTFERLRDFFHEAARLESMVYCTSD